MLSPTCGRANLLLHLHRLCCLGWAAPPRMATRDRARIRFVVAVVRDRATRAPLAAEEVAPQLCDRRLPSWQAPGWPFCLATMAPRRPHQSSWTSTVSEAVRRLQTVFSAHLFCPCHDHRLQLAVAMNLDHRCPFGPRQSENHHLHPFGLDVRWLALLLVYHRAWRGPFFPMDPPPLPFALEELLGAVAHSLQLHVARRWLPTRPFLSLWFSWSRQKTTRRRGHVPMEV